MKVSKPYSECNRQWHRRPDSDPWRSPDSFYLPGQWYGPLLSSFSGRVRLPCLLLYQTRAWSGMLIAHYYTRFFQISLVLLVRQCSTINKAFGFLLISFFSVVKWAYINCVSGPQRKNHWSWRHLLWILLLNSLIWATIFYSCKMNEMCAMHWKRFCYFVNTVLNKTILGSSWSGSVYSF